MFGHTYFGSRYFGPRYFGPTAEVLAYLFPDADISDGGWTNEGGSPGNLFASIDESSFDDDDFIRSETNPVNDVVRLSLSGPDAGLASPMSVMFRYKKVGTGTISLTVRLIEGNSPGTTIAEWEYFDIADTFIDGEEELTPLEFDSIVDFDDLYIEFEATTGSP